VDNVEADEGYSESIARILTDHWETLTRLAQLIQKDRGFGKFVGLSDIDNIEDLEKIRGNAIQHCPAGLSGLCAKLKKDADQSIGAIEDDAASRKHN